MSEPNLQLEDAKRPKGNANGSAKCAEKPVWEEPRLEEVSEQVMAQPYIRFT